MSSGAAKPGEFGGEPGRGGGRAKLPHCTKSLTESSKLHERKAVNSNDEQAIAAPRIKRERDLRQRTPDISTNKSLGDPLLTALLMQGRRRVIVK